MSALSTNNYKILNFHESLELVRKYFIRFSSFFEHLSLFGKLDRLSNPPIQSTQSWPRMSEAAIRPNGHMRKADSRAWRKEKNSLIHRENWAQADFVILLACCHFYIFTWAESREKLAENYLCRRTTWTASSFLSLNLVRSSLYLWSLVRR